jgi:hypothetical protein
MEAPTPVAAPAPPPPPTKTFRFWYRSVADTVAHLDATMPPDAKLWQVVQTYREGGLPLGAAGDPIAWIMPAAILRIEQIDEDEDLGG